MHLSQRNAGAVASVICAALSTILADAALAGVANKEDEFVIFDGSTTRELPKCVGNASGDKTAKVAWYKSGDRRFAGLKLEYNPSARFGALRVSVESHKEVFKDPNFPAQPELITVTCRAARGSTVVLQIADADGSIYEIERSADSESWQDLKVRLDPEMKGWQQVRRGDGRLDGRILWIAVGLRAKTEETGNLELERVTLLPSPLQLEFKTQVPGNMFVTGDRVSGTVKTLGTARVKAVTFAIQDAFGKTIEELPPAAVSAAGAELPLPSEFGYYSIVAKAPGYRPSSGASYTVMPDNRVQGKEPNSPYGVCCHWGDYWYQPIVGTLIKRIGIAWIRDGHHDDSTAQGNAYTVSKSVGLCQMSITGYCPGKEQDVLTDKGEYDFSSFMGRQNAYTKGVADHVDWYDMCNEPCFAWGRVFGTDGKPPRWMNIFTKWFVPQYDEAVSKADPNSHLLIEGYGTEIDALIANGTAKHISAISPHPYAHKSEPEDHGFLNGGYQRHVETMRKHNLKWPVWIGEMGFTTFIGDSQHFKSVTELEQAALLVRALSLHYAAGVEKIFYYDMVEWTMKTWRGDDSNDDYNCEFHFGIVRKDFTAKPAASAYANLIAQTKGCRWLGRSTKGGSNTYIYAFARPGEAPGFVAWTRQGTSQLAIPAGAKITDIFGKQVTSGGGNLTLSTVPVYIHGCSVGSMSIAPVPTYAGMPRFHDATDVRLGVRYGKRSAQRTASGRSSKNGSKSDEASATRSGTSTRPKAPSEDVLAFWDYLLSVRMAEQIEQGEAPRFFMPSTRRTATLRGLTDETNVNFLVDGPGGVPIEMKMSLTKLSLADKASLALAMLRDDVSTDHCLAGFYLLASGDVRKADDHLRLASKSDADEVRAAFKE